MAKVDWNEAINSVSGALSKPGKGQHSCRKMVLATHRVAETTNRNCNRLYVRSKIERSTAPTENEVAQRLKFGTIAKAVNARAKDLTKITADQEAYAAQTKYTTMKSFLWSLEKAEYEKNH